MKKIFSSIHTSICSTPFFGRTILVLSFFCLLVKQVVIFLSFSEVFKEPTLSATLVHYLGYFVSDFLVCMLLLGLVAINALVKKMFIKIINNIIISGIFLLFVLDIFTMYFFQSRISILDMSQFINPSLGDFSGMIISIIIVLCILTIITFFIVQSSTFKKRKKIWLSLYFLLFAGACVGVGMYAPGGLASVPDNILSINFSAFTENLSVLSDKNIPNIYQKFFGKKKGANKKTNIIVVFAESFSPIDSLRVGGVNNNLPYFDLIQKQGITFTNFISNGEVSADAHIALLLGIEPIKSSSLESSYFGYKTYTDPLPLFFANQGYSPIFISTTDLSFLNQKTFLSGIAFNKILGKEGFENQKKYVFDAAPDHILYKKALQTIQKETGSYLMVLETISFHKPYNTPYGTTQKDAIRYTDKSLFYFYLQLKKSGFFKNGLLVVVGDHRKMEPLEAKEKKALGEFWYTRVLATIVGTGITPGTINSNIIQHTDIFHGLKQLVSKGSLTVSKLANDIFSPTKKRDWGIVYCRYSQDRKYTIVSGLEKKPFGDISEIISTNPLIYKYLSSYISFQYGSGGELSGNNTMTVIAHRGTPLATTENSLSGFLLAKKNGAVGIEFDVSYTKDKENIVMHGESVYSTICGDGIKISTHTLDWLQKNCPLTNGESILTLKDMLKKIDGLFEYYFIEIKVYDPKDAEKQTVDAIQTVQKLGMQDRVIFTSYDKTATYILGSYKNITAGRDTFNITELTILPNMNHQYYLMPQTLIKTTTAQEVEDIGKKLVVYTVDTTGDLEKLYHEGVRMVMTDNVPLIKGRADNNLNK